MDLLSLDVGFCDSSSTDPFVKYILQVLEAAKLLHIKEHAVIDASENVFKLAAPVECKGIVGSDNRHYLLDLMRVTPRDANYTGPESRFCVLRPELITSFCQVHIHYSFDT